MSRVEQRWEHLVRAVLSRARMGADAYGRHATGIAGNVPSSLANNRDIDEILRAADEIQDEDPTISRILCEHAYSLAQNLDPNSEGRGVLQFKTGLMSVIKKQGGTPQQEKGAVKAVQDLYDVVQQGGILIFFYLQKIYPDEWKNFLARIGHDENALHFELFDNPTDNLELRFWASYRGQTLARTEGSDVEGAISCNDATDTRGFGLSPEARAHADLKFTYVVTCQIYGKQKEGQKPEAADISIAAQAAARKAEIAAQLSAQDDEYDLTGLIDVRPSNPNANT